MKNEQISKIQQAVEDKEWKGKAIFG
jgi:hypothetical protein